MSILKQLQDTKKCTNFLAFQSAYSERNQHGTKPSLSQKPLEDTYFVRF